MNKSKKNIIISILWFAGLLLLGHAFIPHHHHHHHRSESIAKTCTHHHDNHDGFEMENHRPCPSETNSGDTCEECHLEDEFTFNNTKLIPAIYCINKLVFNFIPKKIGTENTDFIWLDNYAFTFSEHSSYRGPPSLASSLS